MRLVVLTTILATGLLSACNNGGNSSSTTVELNNTTDSLSYAMGLMSGDAYFKDGMDINRDIYVAAFDRAIDGKDALMSTNTAKTYLNKYFTKMNQQMELEAFAEMEEEKKRSQAFLDANAKKEGVKVTDSGLQYEVLKAGSGKSLKSEAGRARIHYTGMLQDGTVFDSSVKRGEPVVFNANGVIPGWTETLMMMKEGDKWRISMPSDLGYGDRGNMRAGIAPGAALVFELEMLEVL